MSVTDIREYPARRINRLKAEKYRYAARVLRDEATLMEMSPQATEKGTTIMRNTAQVLRQRADQIETIGKELDDEQK